MRTDFLFARNARIFAARQSLATKTTKTRAFFSKNFFNVSEILCPGFKSSFSAYSACFWASGTLPKPRAACFHPLGVLPLLSPRSFVFWEHSYAFPEAFSGFGCIPSHSSKRFWASGTLPKPRAACFRALGVLPRLSPRSFVFWEAAECSHRHCPRVARKSYKIFSSGG